ncbi:hypothetical protein [Micromonospora sp. RTGN7]|uniref:hypothetical protein n=1 Tax=Micromonospora sp. RTGN7 TaxID=3016526 RepID=UPI0029FF1D03|nr:hypothetical protein [Micromonospora sp. RTGN7]
MSETQGRTADILEALEARWREHGAPIAGRLAPGLAEDELAARFRPLGSALPDELRLWWGRHDGVRRFQPGTRLGTESQVGPGGWELLSLDEALSERALMLKLCGRPHYPADDRDWDGYWRPSWMPLFAFDANLVFANLDGATDVGVPLHLWAAQPEDVGVAHTASLTDLLAIWERLLGERYYWWSADEGRWEDRRPEVPMSLIHAGLL